MLEAMKDIIRKNDLCVLATVSEGSPHCSLMSYVSDESGHEIYLVSHRDTKKYLNMMQNPSVSLLIDNREENPGQARSNIKALTVKGKFHAITEPAEKDAVRVRFQTQHPHLMEFLNDHGIEVFSIKIESLQLLDGVTDIFFETVK
jgi:nitroimidazol reductase NimA-like FMN-containing flavoprotein (pyridoxamine 5'-phosphate oxidase superfamily)